MEETGNKDSGRSPDLILDLLAQADDLIRNGQSVTQVCDLLKVSEEELTEWLERYAMPPEAIEQLNDIKPKDAIVPIFKSSSNGSQVEHIGSGIALAIGPDKYLITAAHVSDREEDEEIYIPTESGITPISGMLFSMPIPEGLSRKSDMVDVAYYRLSHSLADNLHNTIKPLTISDIETNLNVETGDYYTFCGYPWRKTKRIGNVQQTDLATYTGQVVSQKEYTEQGLTPGLHIAIRFRLKKSYSYRYQSYKTSPLPEGVSGGPALVWPQQIKGRLTHTEFKVGGIFHTYKKKANLLIATNISPFIESLIENSPHLSETRKSASDNAKQFTQDVSERIAKANPRNVPVIQGVVWYRPDEYADCLKIFDDAQMLPDNFEKWLARALATESQMILQGMAVKRVMIRPKPFVSWCKKSKISRRDANARVTYVSQIAASTVHDHT